MSVPLLVVVVVVEPEVVVVVELVQSALSSARVAGPTAAFEPHKLKLCAFRRSILSFLA